MRRNRFVYPEEVRLQLSDGDWIDVKKTLNAGEYRQLLIAQTKDGADGDLVIDHAKMGIARLLAYLLGWSFVGSDGAPVPYHVEQPEAIRQATLDNLSPDTWRELVAAVAAHDSAQANAIEEKKKEPATASSS